MALQPYILLIESATDICSVALIRGNELISEAVSKKKYAHESRIIILIEQCLLTAKIDALSLDCIAVSIGPGSYTGLRIGLSTAKGLCFGLNIPLICINTLSIIAVEPIHKYEQRYKVYMPMIDARRDEVYASLIDPLGNVIQDDQPFIINKESVAQLEQEFESICFCGTGCFKVSPFTNVSTIHSNFPIASQMGLLALKKWKEKNFTNIFSASPSYLKKPNITTAKTRITH